jgi:hypothetical protein
MGRVMKSLICLGVILLAAAQVNAETYSWVDDSGTYNFTEDFSAIPKKYRKKAKKRDDAAAEETPQAAPEQVSTPIKTGKSEVKPAAAPSADKELYGGKSRAEWRNELDVQEAGLAAIEQRIEQLKKQIYDSRVLTNLQFHVLKKEYDDKRAEYQQKYKEYTELVETIRKAGITVNIK